MSTNSDNGKLGSYGAGKGAGSYGDVVLQKNVKTVMDKESYE